MCRNVAGETFARFEKLLFVFKKTNLRVFISFYRKFFHARIREYDGRQMIIRNICVKIILFLIFLKSCWEWKVNVSFKY